MTYPKLPGMYFSSEAISTPQYDNEHVPLFIIQTSTAIATLDNQITLFDNFNAFKEIVKNVTGFAKTITYIEDALLEAEQSSFYVYSIKTDTTAGFTEAITATSHLEEVVDVVYIEQTKSGNVNTITDKISAIQSGLSDNEENGVFRVAYIIPYGTINDAVTNAENTTPEAACLASLQTITAGEGSGRICIIVPDENAGFVAGKCIGTEYNVEAGYPALTNINTTTSYNFDANQMLTLQNRGIMFVKTEKIQGILQYRINLAVTTSFKESKGDGLLVSLRITDELLRQIKFNGFGLIKDVGVTKADVETVVSGVVDKFAKNEEIKRDDTILSVTETSELGCKVSGKVRPVKSLVAIEVGMQIE